MRKWMEELFDTLLLTGLFVGLLFFFQDYWRNAYQIRCAETVMEEFLAGVSAEGKITLEAYETLVQNIEKINSAYEVEIILTETTLYPCYDRVSKEQLDQYYAARNQRKIAEFLPFEVVVEEEPAEKLCLQTETNASLLAAGGEEYLPLPGEETVLQPEAVRNRQEVYVGEPLITLCKVTSAEGSYYVEAEPVTAMESGIIMLEVDIGFEKQSVPVEVVCYPRKVMCANGHEVVNTGEIIEIYQQTGQIACPYCNVIPGRLECNTAFLSKQTGECLREEEVWLTVTFLDGHVEKITPAHEEWQDSYDETYCGLQNVVIQYRDKQETLGVLTENGVCKQCAGACNERCYADYMAFPYCTACMSEKVLFTGKVFEEETELGTKELVAFLDEDGEFILKRGDYVQGRIVSDGLMSVLQTEILCDGKRRWE